MDVLRTAENLPLGEIELFAAFESGMDPVQILNPVRDANGHVCDYRILYVNPALLAADGVRAEDLTGVLVREAFPDVAAELTDLWDHVIETGDPVARDGIAIPRSVDGSVRRFDVRAGSFGSGLIVVYRDVTDQFDAAERLSRSERLYRLLAENITDVVFVLRDEEIAWASPSSEVVLGWRSDDLIGRRWTDFISSEDHGAITAWLTDETADARARFRVRYLTRDGAVHWAALTVGPLLDEAGNADGVLVSGRRIDEEMAAEAEVRKAHRQRDRLIEQLPVGVFRARLSATRELALDFVSPLAWKLLRAMPEESFGLEGVVGRIHPDDRDMLLRAGQAAVAGTSPLVWEGRVADTDPQVWLRIQAQVEELDQERLIEGILADITQAKEQEADLASKAKSSESKVNRMAEIDRTKSALLAALGHDLRTPLAVISSSATSLRNGATLTTNQKAELLSNIEAGSDSLTHMLGDLLDLGRIEAGALPVRIVSVDIIEVLGEPLRTAGAAVALDMPEDLPCVEADAGLLERVLDNLLRNAQRYQPPGIPVTVAAEAAGGRVRLRVIDNGPGVARARYEDIFRPFARTGNQGADGIGLGLTIARDFTVAMGGTLTPSATPGGGLTMTIDLKECDAQAADR